MNKFQLLPLTLAVSAAFTTTAFAAVSQPKVVLAGDTVVSDRQGAKIKTNVVTLREKDERTATDLRGLLQGEPAIDFGGGNGTSQFISIRGMGQNSIDTKIDNAYTDSQFLYHQGRFMLDPQMVKVVSVQKGAGFASAGIGATNGAIVTKTLDADELLRNSDKDYGFKVGAGLSTNKGHSYHGSAFGKAQTGFGQVDALVSYNKVDESDYKGGKGYTNLLGNDVVTSSALDKSSFLAKAGLTAGDHRFVVSHLNQTHKGIRGVREEFDFANSDLTIDIEKKGKIRTEADLLAELNKDYPGQGYKLGKKINDKDNKVVGYHVVDANGRQVPNLDRNRPAYRETIQKNINLEYQGKLPLGNVTANIYKQDNLRHDSANKNNGYLGGFEKPVTSKYITHGANFNIDTYPMTDLVVKYGLNYRHQELIPAEKKRKGDTVGRSPKTFDLPVDIINQEKTDIGVYAEAIKDYGPWTLTGGLRYDHFEFTAMDGKKRKDGNINPSLGVIYQVNPDLSVNGVLNMATRSPRMYDTLLAQGHRGIVSIDDDTKAELAKNAEIGFNYNNGTVFADGSIFYQKTENALGNFANSRHGVKINSIKNVGHMTNKGYELGVGYAQGPLTGRIGVSESRPELVGVQLSGNPEFALPVGRTWTASLGYKVMDNLEVGINNKSVQGTDRAVLSHKTEPEYRPGYSVSDIYANWKPYGNDKMNVNFSVNNVFDKNYRPHSERASVIALPGAGRDFRVGVNFTY
ncbi:MULTISPECIES: TonB-dependent siderophore receptor [Moraxella]|uniref:Outer membrane receptor protein, mostly Fe transport n=1 Tax=Moraxella catarrhalis TaxID=480 RepID=A0A7Z0UWI6_MORCA|nr:TonB-dependent siderophore receptor [Moraxella catarrhalis]OAU98754.1 Outer membrane receptor protein, mostly Fe transport [Moraxella catarrhalis]STY81368.1 Heme/hemopexin utilization protein C precursor [Moraxella catarrhalis]